MLVSLKSNSANAWVNSLRPDCWAQSLPIHHNSAGLQAYRKQGEEKSQGLLPMGRKKMRGHDRASLTMSVHNSYQVWWCHYSQLLGAVARYVATVGKKNTLFAVDMLKLNRKMPFHYCANEADSVVDARSCLMKWLRHKHPLDWWFSFGSSFACFLDRSLKTRLAGWQSSCVSPCVCINSEREKAVLHASGCFLWRRHSVLAQCMPCICSPLLSKWFLVLFFVHRQKA